MSEYKTENTESRHESFVESGEEQNKQSLSKLRSIRESLVELLNRIELHTNRLTEQVVVIELKRKLLVESLQKVETIIYEYIKHDGRLHEYDFDCQEDKFKCQEDRRIANAVMFINMRNIDYLINWYENLLNKLSRWINLGTYTIYSSLALELQLNLFGKTMIQSIYEAMDKTAWVIDDDVPLSIMNGTRFIDPTISIKDVKQGSEETLNKVYLSLREMF